MWFQSIGIQNGGDLADTAIRALEGGALSYNGNPSKSTLIIHSVQRVRIISIEFFFALKNILKFNQKKQQIKGNIQIEIPILNLSHCSAAVAI